MPLSNAQIRFLRGLAHKLKPVVTVGNNGLTEAVIRETDLSLNAHELIKVRINGDDKTQRQQVANEICDSCEAQPILSIGHVIAIYRPKKTPTIVLPGD